MVAPTAGTHPGTFGPFSVSARLPPSRWPVGRSISGSSARWHGGQTESCELTEPRCNGPGDTIRVEQADLGHRAGRFDERCLPVELVSAAVPAQTLCGTAVRSETAEAARELVEPRDLLIGR